MSLPVTAIGGLARLVWECIALSLAYGVAIVALLQFVNDISARRRFNRNALHKFLNDDNLRKELVALATAGDAQALYDLSIDKLAGQVNMAAVSIIETPSRHPELLRAMAAQANSEDVDLLINTSPDQFRVPNLEFLPPDLQAQMSRLSDARNRVSHHIQRTIDALQISVAQKWKRRNQSVSLTLSFIVGVFAPLVHGREAFTFRVVIISVCLALLGGLLAPILRDFVTSAQTKN